MPVHKYRFNELGSVDLFKDQEEGLKYGIMFSISVPLAFRTQGFATRAFLGTTTGALSPKQNVSYEYTVSPTDCATKCYPIGILLYS